MLLIIFIFIFILILTIRVVTYSVKKNFRGRQKRGVYECGFSPQTKSFKAFSMRFFHILLVFLVFDVELVFLFPLGLLNRGGGAIYILISVVGVSFLLMWGLFYEWKVGVFFWGS